MSFFDEIFSHTENLGEVKAKKSVKSIYNTAMFADCADKDDFKSIRRKIRKEFDEKINSFVSAYSAKNAKDLESSIKSFLKFYEKTFSTHNFTPESVCDVEKKKNSLGGDMWLKRVKKLLEISSNYATAKGIKF